MTDTAASADIPWHKFLDESEKCYNTLRLINGARELTAAISHRQGAQELLKELNTLADKLAVWDDKIQNLKAYDLLKKRRRNPKRDNYMKELRKKHCVREPRHGVVWANFS
ncbi:MAG: hypothetical protein Q9194_006964 [Teloschistes cf. exilis]